MLEGVVLEQQLGAYGAGFGRGIEFGGQEIRSFNRRALRNYRRRMQIVFQDPFSSLNPRHRVRE